jgi:hypothetical protein
MDLRSIAVPPNWTPEKDFESFTDRHGETNNYYDYALAEVAKSYASLHEAADNALRYYERRDHRLVPAYPGTLTLAEKLHRLGTMTQTFNEDYAYKRRFAEHIHGCTWADTERCRVMQAHLASQEQMWLHPLCDLADGLGCAANELREAMKCEHDDYTEEVNDEH